MLILTLFAFLSCGLFHRTPTAPVLTPHTPQKASKGGVLLTPLLRAHARHRFVGQEAIEAAALIARDADCLLKVLEVGVRDRIQAERRQIRTVDRTWFEDKV